MMLWLNMLLFVVVVLLLIMASLLSWLCDFFCEVSDGCVCMVWGCRVYVWWWKGCVVLFLAIFVDLKLVDCFG